MFSRTFNKTFHMNRMETTWKNQWTSIHFVKTFKDVWVLEICQKTQRLFTVLSTNNAKWLILYFLFLFLQNRIVSLLHFANPLQFFLSLLVIFNFIFTFFLVWAFLELLNFDFLFQKIKLFLAWEILNCLIELNNRFRKVRFH